MGKRGPAPKPTALRVLHGERQSKRRQEPIPAQAEVRPPAWLSRKAKAVWRRLAPDLEARGVLTCWDVEAFAGYVDAVVRRSEAARHLEHEGEVTEQPVFDRNGCLTGHRLARSPWSYVFKDADQQVQRWGARFGLTPSERGQIKLPNPGNDEDDDLLT
jgi:P27 family predicted phage terminase small subunit